MQCIFRTYVTNMVLFFTWRIQILRRTEFHAVTNLHDVSVAAAAPVPSQWRYYASERNPPLTGKAPVGQLMQWCCCLLLGPMQDCGGQWQSTTHHHCHAPPIIESYHHQALPPHKEIRHNVHYFIDLKTFWSKLSFYFRQYKFVHITHNYFG